MKIRFQLNHSLCLHPNLLGLVGPCFVSLNILLFLQLLFHLPKFGRNSFIEKSLKNTIDLLLFYGEHFYRFSESDLSYRCLKNE